MRDSRFHLHLTLSEAVSANIVLVTLRKKGVLDTISTPLMQDINTVLSVYEKSNQNNKQSLTEAQTANNAFLKTYSSLFKKNEFTTFENDKFRILMRTVAQQISHALREQPVTASSVLAPPTYPGFNREATNLAFELILHAHLQNFQNASASLPVPALSPGPDEPPSAPITTSTAPASAATLHPTRERNRKVWNVFATARQQIRDANVFQPYLDRLGFRSPLPDIATRNTSPDTLVTAAATSAAPGHMSWKGKHPEENAAIHQVVSSMAAGNEKFRNWLAAHNIEAVPNRGWGLNCLIISLLQHATGAYGPEYELGFADKAQQYRHTLEIDPGMLYSDERSVAAIVDAINHEFEIDLNLVEVQSNELGLPFIATPLESLPEQTNKVVVWQQGDHFEALYARTTVPTS